MKQYCDLTKLEALNFLKLFCVNSLVNPSADQEVRGFQITHLA